MCGIAGWLGCLPDAETYAARLQQAMRHRGPDGHGAQLWADAGLLHTRLSILDLSPAGAQPITNVLQSTTARRPLCRLLSAVFAGPFITSSCRVIPPIQSDAILNGIHQ